MGSSRRIIKKKQYMWAIYEIRHGGICHRLGTLMAASPELAVQQSFQMWPAGHLSRTAAHAML